jgi:hypothetical protein
VVVNDGAPPVNAGTPPPIGLIKKNMFWGLTKKLFWVEFITLNLLMIKKFINIYTHQ